MRINNDDVIKFMKSEDQIQNIIKEIRSSLDIGDFEKAKTCSEDFCDNWDVLKEFAKYYENTNDYDKAIEIYESLIKNGDKSSYSLLGNLYLANNDEKKAFECYNTGSDSDKDCAYSKGLLLYRNEQFDDAENCFIESLRMGNVQALLSMIEMYGTILQNGNQNTDHYKNLIFTCADAYLESQDNQKGFSGLYRVMARLISEGTILPEEWTSGVESIMRMANRDKDPIMEAVAAKIYLHGLLGMEPNLDKSVHLYTSIIKKDIVIESAYLEFAELELSGSVDEIRYPPMYLVEKVLTLNPRNPHALSLKAMMLYYGCSVKKDVLNSVTYFLKSSEYDITKPISTAYLGMMYVTGFPFVQNVEKGMQMLNSVADDENLRPFQKRSANYLLGLIYFYGYGVEKDFSKAMHYFENIKDRVGKTFVSLLYHYIKSSIEINGYLKDEDENILSKSIKTSDWRALEYYGDLNIEQNPSTAREYYERARRFGSPSALDKLLKNRMFPDETYRNSDKKDKTTESKIAALKMCVNSTENAVVKDRCINLMRILESDYSA